MKRPNKRTALILCVCMIIGSCMSGTLAYLTSEAGDINTFVIGKIKIELSETDTQIDQDEDEKTNTYEIKGLHQSITKDPTITVQAGSAPCWLFVEIVESENFTEFLEYQMADDWETLKGHTNVYYRKIAQHTFLDTDYPVLKENRVNLKPTVTVEALNQLNEKTYPKLSVKAYAMQLGAEGTVLGTPEEAWKQLDTRQN